MSVKVLHLTLTYTSPLTHCPQSELFNLLESEELAQTPILVYANKQDLKDAMGVEELTASLSLHSIKNHDWHIQACCALTGMGLLDGLGWIHQRTARPGAVAP